MSDPLGNLENAIRRAADAERALADAAGHLRCVGDEDAELHGKELLLCRIRVSTHLDKLYEKRACIVSALRGKTSASQRSAT